MIHLGTGTSCSPHHLSIACASGRGYEPAQPAPASLPALLPARDPCHSYPGGEGGTPPCLLHSSLRLLYSSVAGNRVTGMFKDRLRLWPRYAQATSTAGEKGRMPAAPERTLGTRGTGLGAHCLQWTQSKGGHQLFQHPPGAGYTALASPVPGRDNGGPRRLLVTRVPGVLRLRPEHRAAMVPAWLPRLLLQRRSYRQGRGVTSGSRGAPPDQYGTARGCSVDSSAAFGKHQAGTHHSSSIYSPLCPRRGGARRGWRPPARLLA